MLPEELSDELSEFLSRAMVGVGWGTKVGSSSSCLELLSDTSFSESEVIAEGLPFLFQLSA